MAHIYNAGIDYGRGLANVDLVTSFRYGVISQHSVGEVWYEDAEADYGKPHCPECGNDAITVQNEACEEFELAHGACGDYACTDCEYLFDADQAFNDEPLGYSYDREGYSLTDCLDSDIFVLKSPYFTRGQFCSPCVPGGVNLDNADMRGERAYCLGHDWFEGQVAPYPVFSVETGELILA